MTAASPTPPAPMIPSGRPPGEATAFRTAPTPVMTAQAAIAATSGGTPSGTLATLVSDTTTRSAKHETPMRWWIRSSPPCPSVRCRRVVPSNSPFVLANTPPYRQSTGLPRTQASHSPQRGRQRRATRSPTATRAPAPGPSASTMPAPSWPTTTGSRAARSPVM